MTLSFEVRIEVGEGNVAQIVTTRDLPAWNDRFGQRMRELLAHAVQGPLAFRPAAAGGPADDDTYLAPGQPLREPYAGALHDYSGCAPEGELGALRQGRFRSGDTPSRRPRGRARTGRRCSPARRRSSTARCCAHRRTPARPS